MRLLADVPALPLGPGPGSVSRQGAALGSQQIGQAMRTAARTAGAVIGQQRGAHGVSVQATGLRQVIKQQVHQLFQRKLMRLAGRLPQPVAEAQKMMEGR